MAKYHNGQTLACEWCGREVVVDCCGDSATDLYCCDRPMTAKRKPAARKRAKSKTCK